MIIKFGITTGSEQYHNICDLPSTLASNYFLLTYYIYYYCHRLSSAFRAMNNIVATLTQSIICFSNLLKMLSLLTIARITIQIIIF